MRMNINVDNLQAMTRLQRNFDQAIVHSLPVISEKVLGDINNYVPRDTGQLVNSSYTASNFDTGELVWNTPYARRLYYGVDMKFSKDVHPLAQAMWDVKAKSVHEREWARFLGADIMRRLR